MSIANINNISLIIIIIYPIMLHDDEIVFNYVYRIFLFDLSWFKMEEKKNRHISVVFLFVRSFIHQLDGPRTSHTYRLSCHNIFSIKTILDAHLMSNDFIVNETNPQTRSLFGVYFVECIFWFLRTTSDVIRAHHVAALNFPTTLSGIFKPTILRRLIFNDRTLSRV